MAQNTSRSPSRERGTGSMSAETESSPTALTANAFTNVETHSLAWNTVANGSGTPYANDATYAFNCFRYSLRAVDGGRQLHGDVTERWRRIRCLRSLIVHLRLSTREWRSPKWETHRRLEHGRQRFWRARRQRCNVRLYFFPLLLYAQYRCASAGRSAPSINPSAEQSGR